MQKQDDEATAFGFDSFTPYEEIQETIYMTVPRRQKRMPPCDCVEDEACNDSSNCFNRSMRVECRAGSCRCGELCQNQRLQRCQGAAVNVQRAGKKGWGLFATEAVRAHAFVIEYVGELVDHRAFQRRVKRYRRDGYPHHYFMTLSPSEVIDATKKGSPSRFFNHSCDPNCVTQKWIVGEVERVGFFALRDIAVGEELTFDYQMQTYGRLAQACFCGAANCREVIGGSRVRVGGEERVNGGGGGEGEGEDGDEGEEGEEAIEAEEAEEEADEDVDVPEIVYDVRTMFDAGKRKSSSSSSVSQHQRKKKKTFEQEVEKMKRRVMSAVSKSSTESDGTARLDDVLTTIIRDMVMLEVGSDEQVGAAASSSSPGGHEMGGDAALWESERRRGMLLGMLESFEESLLRAFVIRGVLQPLRFWLLEAVGARRMAFVGRLLSVLERLPVHTRNIVDDSKILRAVKQAGDKVDGMRSLVDTLTDKWAKLPSEFRIRRQSRPSQSSATPPSHSNSNISTTTNSTTTTTNNNNSSSSSSSSVASSKRRADFDLSSSWRSASRPRLDSSNSSDYRTPPRPLATRASSPPLSSSFPTTPAISASAPATPQRPSLSFPLVEVADDEAALSLVPFGWSLMQDQKGVRIYRDKVSSALTFERPPPSVNLADKPVQLNVERSGAEAEEARERQRRIEAAAQELLERQRREREANSGKLEGETEFKEKLASAVMRKLKVFQSDSCTLGRITSKDDFKHLCRKIVHLVMEKERRGVQSLSFTKKTDIKVDKFIAAYMEKMGPIYVRK